MCLTLKKWKGNNNSRYEKKTFPIKLSPPQRSNKGYFNPHIETLGFIMDLYKNRQIIILVRRLVLILGEVNPLRGLP